jgi:hypothetical protein
MVHQATVKKGEGKGIIVEDAPEGSDYRFRVFWPERSMELWGSNAADLLNVAIHARMMSLEHGLKFEQEEDTIMVTFNGHDVTEFEADLSPAQFEREVADALDEITDEMRSDIAEADEEEVEARGSVVPEKYKQEYKARGTPGNCGDWLALELKQVTTLAKGGQVDVSAVDAIAQANGLNTGKYDRTNPGWQGRLRMTVRNSLVKKIMDTGVLFIPAPFGGTDDVELKAPDSWLEDMARRRKTADAALAPNRKKKVA